MSLGQLYVDLAKLGILTKLDSAIGVLTRVSVIAVDDDDIVMTTQQAESFTKFIAGSSTGTTKLTIPAKENEEPYPLLTLYIAAYTNNPVVIAYGAQEITIDNTEKAKMVLFSYEVGFVEIEL